MNKKILISAIVVLIITVLAFVFLQPTDPDDVVRAFYNDWISYDGDPLLDRIYQNDERITGNFIISIDEAVESAGEDLVDPILCADGRPLRFSTSIVNSGRGQASVSVLMAYEEAVVRSEVSLLRLDGEWKLDEVRCVDPLEDEDGEESGFEEEGNLTREGDSWFLVYEEPGSPALRAKLSFDSQSSCIEGGIRTLCLSGILEVGTRVKVSGELDEENEEVLVKSLQTVQVESLEGTVINIDDDREFVTFLIGGGTEAIVSNLSEASITHSSGEGARFNEINLGDRIRVTGMFTENNFAAEMAEITFSSSKTGSREEGSEISDD